MCQICNSTSCTGQCQNGWPYVNQPQYNPPFTTPFNRCAPVVPPPNPAPCPPSPCAITGCLNPITTNCVFTSNILSCLGLPANTSLTNVLAAIDAKLCNMASARTYTINSVTWVCDGSAGIMQSITFTPNFSSSTPVMITILYEVLAAIGAGVTAQNLLTIVTFPSLIQGLTYTINFGTTPPVQNGAVFSTFIGGSGSIFTLFDNNGGYSSGFTQNSPSCNPS